MKCEKCGKISNSKFCPECGAKMPEPEQTAPDPVPEKQHRNGYALAVAIMATIWFAIELIANMISGVFDPKFVFQDIMFLHVVATGATLAAAWASWASSYAEGMLVAAIITTVSGILQFWTVVFQLPIIICSWIAWANMRKN